MLTKIYGYAWLVFAALFLLTWVTNNLSLFSLVVFGFAAFGMVFMGMIGVLPVMVAHPAKRQTSTRPVESVTATAPTSISRDAVRV